MPQNNEIVHHIWKPLAHFNLCGNFWTLEPDTLITTWIILGLIFIISRYIFRCLHNEHSLVRYVVLQYVKFFQDLIFQSINACPINHLAMITSLFTFIFICNTIQIIPGLEEPTKSLNTTFALGLISFFYVHFNSIKTKGWKHYLLHYFEPFFLMFPLHIISTFSSILSISFRLYGNIFGSSMISSLYAGMLSNSLLKHILDLVTGTGIGILIIFGICEGLIQAFVFTMLTLTSLSMAILSDQEETTESINLNP